MILFRLILLIAVLWLGYRIYRLLHDARAGRRLAREPGEEMVGCRLCELHVPRSGALRHEAHWFCCEDHRRRYLESAGRDR